MNMLALQLMRCSDFVRELDRALLLPALAIASIGLVMICSASISFADHSYGDAFFYLKRHLLFLLMGAVVAAVFLNVPSRFWFHYGVPLLVLTLLLLVAVLIPGVGRRVNGSQRWIPLGPLNLQVSEIAKFVMILFTAGYLERYQRELRENWRYFAKPIGLLGVVAVLLLLEPDFGSSV